MSSINSSQKSSQKQRPTTPVASPIQSSQKRQSPPVDSQQSNKKQKKTQVASQTDSSRSPLSLPITASTNGLGSLENYTKNNSTNSVNKPITALALLMQDRDLLNKSNEKK